MPAPFRKRIIILEDDADLANSLRDLLSMRLKAEVKLTGSVTNCLDAIDSQSYDVLIADWLLADGETGLEVLTYVKEFHYQLKVLMLTCQKLVDHRLKAYRRGADAYLTKPFNSQELLIKLDQLFNSYKLCDSGAINYPGITLYPSTGRLLIDSKPVQINPKESEILTLLLINHARVLSKQRILDLVWTDLNSQPSFNTVEVYIRRIRHRLGKYGVCLFNKRGFGYCFDSGKLQ